MPTSTSSPLSAVSDHDGDTGDVDVAQDYLRDASYEPSDGATPATVDDEASQGTSQGKKKRASAVRNGKIKRAIFSCDQCQRKKTRCNRVSPCDGCITRGESCTWQKAQPVQISIREANIATDINTAVSTLQSLVSQIQGIVDSASALSPLQSVVPDADILKATVSSASTSLAVPSTSLENRTGLPVPAAVAPSPSSQRGSSKMKPSSDKIDVQGDDICEALAQLAVGHVQMQRPRTGMVKVCPLLEEARILAESLPQVFGLEFDMPPFNPFSSAPIASSTASLAALLLRLPPQPLADVSCDFYHRFMDSFFHPLHVPTFNSNAERLRRQVQEARWQEVDIFLAATYLAVCALGTATMSEERAVKKGFPPGRKSTLSKEWLALSLHALNLGHFFDRPAFEALRALFLISAYFICQADGNSAAPALKTLSLTIQLAYDIGLDRDPDELDETFTVIEAEERRRFIHTMLAFQVTFTGHLGRPSGHAITKQALSCRLPRDCEDADLVSAVNPAAVRKPSDKETVMSPVLARIQLAEISRDLNDLLLSPGSVSIDAIQEIDSRLKDFRNNLPSWYQIRFEDNELHFPVGTSSATQIRSVLLHMCLWTEVLRLHRPFLLRGLMDPSRAGSSRQSCVEAARILLAIHRLPTMRQIWSGIQWQGYNAAVALGIDVLCHPDDAQTDLYLGEIREARDLMAAHSDCSLMMKKGVKIMGLILSRIDNYRLTRSRQSSKRGRLGGYYKTLFSTPSVMLEQERPKEEDLHHKERPSSIPSLKVGSASNRPLHEWQPESLHHGVRNLDQQAATASQTYSENYPTSSALESIATTYRPTTAYAPAPQASSSVVSSPVFHFQAPQMPSWPGALPAFQPETPQYRVPPSISAPLPLMYQSSRSDYFQPHRMPPHQYHYTYPQTQQELSQPPGQFQRYPAGPLQEGPSYQRQAPETPGRHASNATDPWRDAGGTPSGATLLDAIDWSKDFST